MCSSTKNEEAWVELFIDLVYAALLYKLGEILIACSLNPTAFVKTFVLFWSMCLTRMAMDEYANRFYSDDLVHKLMYLIYTAGVFVQVINVNAGSQYSSYDNSPNCEYVGEYSEGIAVGILVTRVALILIHILVMFHNRKAAKQFAFDLLRWGTTVLAGCSYLIIRKFVTQSRWLDIGFLVVITAQESCVWLVSRSVYRHRYTYPIDLDLTQTRWGVWVMLVIGEGIFQMLIAPLPLEYVVIETYVSLIALVLLFSLAMQYYDACQREWFDHAITQSALAGVVWIWLHPVLTYFLFLLGVSLRMLLHGVYAGELAVPLMSYAIAIVTITLTIMRLSHLNFAIKTLSEVGLYGSRLLVFGLQLSVKHWGVSAKEALISHTLISIILLNGVDVAYDIYFAINDEASKHKVAANPRPWAGLNIQGTISRKKKFSFNETLTSIKIHHSSKSTTAPSSGKSRVGSCISCLSCLVCDNGGGEDNNDYEGSSTGGADNHHMKVKKKQRSLWKRSLMSSWSVSTNPRAGKASVSGSSDAGDHGIEGTRVFTRALQVVREENQVLPFKSPASPSSSSHHSFVRRHDHNQVDGAPSREDAARKDNDIELVVVSNDCESTTRSCDQWMSASRPERGLSNSGRQSPSPVQLFAKEERCSIDSAQEDNDDIPDIDHNCDGSNVMTTSRCGQPVVLRDPRVVKVTATPHTTALRDHSHQQLQTQCEDSPPPQHSPSHSFRVAMKNISCAAAEEASSKRCDNSHNHEGIIATPTAALGHIGPFLSSGQLLASSIINSAQQDISSTPSSSVLSRSHHNRRRSRDVREAMLQGSTADDALSSRSSKSTAADHTFMRTLS